MRDERTGSTCIPPGRPNHAVARRRATAGLLGLAMLAGPTAAGAADIPGTGKTRAVLKTGPAGINGTFERRGDSDWYRVTLKGGQDYAFSSSGFHGADCPWLNLRSPGGKVLGSAREAYEDGDDGLEFRPAAAGTFLVEFVDCSSPREVYPAGYHGRVTADARGDTTTRAALVTGQTVSGLANWGDDVDYFRTTLDHDRSYTVEVDGGLEVALRLVDSLGNVVASDRGASVSLRGVRVAASGTYYVVVAGEDDFGSSYTLGLTTP